MSRKGRNRQPWQRPFTERTTSAPVAKSTKIRPAPASACEAAACVRYEQVGRFQQARTLKVDFRPVRRPLRRGLHGPVQIE